MSLVIAFIGARGAVMAGDLREIRFHGDPSSEQLLEEELYDGRIVTDTQLTKRAQELGVYLEIHDTKQKVTDRNSILIGEVSSRQGGSTQRRRLYAAAGDYAIVDIEGITVTKRYRGKGSNFVVLGNTITKQIAHGIIRERWKNGNLADAITLIVQIMETASQTTASVSRQFILVQTASLGDITLLLEQDREAIETQNEPDRNPGVTGGDDRNKVRVPDD